VLYLVKPQRIIKRDRLPKGWHQATAEELRKNPWLRLVVEEVSRKGSRRKFPTRAAVEAFARENPGVNFQTILVDGGECPPENVWFFVRRQGRTDFDQPWPVSERLVEMPWLLKRRASA
jgi:hypothetical protein